MTTPPASAEDPSELGLVDQAARNRLAGSWEEAAFTKTGIRLAAWALSVSNLEAPVSYELRWGGKVHRFTNLVTRADVGRMYDCETPTCGLKIDMPVAFHDIPLAPETDLPELEAIWRNGSKLLLKPSDDARRFQFRYFGFTTRADFEKNFQNPAFRVPNFAAITWASRRAMELFPNDASCFMSSFCILIYRHIENDYLPAAEIFGLIPKWDKVEAGLASPLRGERYRWVISVKLGLGYFYLIQKDYDNAKLNFDHITGMEEQLPSWPQASTNILIAVFMSAWLEYRRSDDAASLARLSRAYEVLKAGVTYLPVWSKHHFAELENSLRIARECFAFQKFLEGETRDHILPISSKLSFKLISAVLAGMIDRGQIEDGPFPARGEKPPAPTLRP